MGFYTEASGDVLKKVKQYIKFGEMVKISDVVELNNKLYREVVFSKKFMNMFRKEATGYLYITENGEVVNQKQIQEKLAKLCYYAGVFLDEDNRTSLINALQNEGDVERDIRDYNDAIKAIDFLVGEGYEKASAIKGIIAKVPDLREKSNERLKQVISAAKDFQEKDGYFNEEINLKLNDSYKEVLRLNFDKVKLISSGADYYDEIKRKGEKMRKKGFVRFNSNLTTPLMRLDYVICYFRRVTSTYAKILNMSVPQYMKYLISVEKQNVDLKIQLLRNV